MLAHLYHMHGNLLTETFTINMHCKKMYESNLVFQWVLIIEIQIYYTVTLHLHRLLFVEILDCCV